MLVLVAVFAVGIALGWLAGSSYHEPCVDESSRSASRVDDNVVSGRGTRRVQGAGDGVELKTNRASDTTFEPALTREEFLRHQKAVGATEATVEHIRDENGLTVDEAHEKFKREHPEEWAQRLAQREARRKIRHDEVEKRLELLDSIAGQHLSERQRKTHEAFLDAIAVQENIRAMMDHKRQNGETVTPEERMALNQAQKTIRDQGAAEREALLEALAKSSGYAGDDVKAFADIIRRVYEATSTRSHRH